MTTELIGQCRCGRSIAQCCCDPAPPKREYYIQDKRSMVGNSMLWWRKGGLGYGCNLAEAEVFSLERAQALIRSSGYKYRAWPKEYIDQRVSQHVDLQHVELDSALPDQDHCGCFTCVKERGAESIEGMPETSTRMIVCDQCGNKRCPRATNHIYACTFSNEPGQPGSRFA